MGDGCTSIRVYYLPIVIFGYIVVYVNTVSKQINVTYVLLCISMDIVIFLLNMSTAQCLFYLSIAVLVNI